jgi:hypothetical protein
MSLHSAILLFSLTALGPVPAETAPGAVDTVEFSDLPANTWVLIHREDGSGGKRFARAILAENVGRLYLWGTGGEKPSRNVYRTYELESFDPLKPGWQAALPTAMLDRWTDDDYPPFRIWGQSGPDGLDYREGPRLQVVGGYHSTNRIRWWDFDGVLRPSPIHTFNMACWDSKRRRIVYYSDGCTFALDPGTNTWNDLEADNYPATCRTVAWASMCYDPLGDQILLFGGGLATNPSGAAPTWIYDCPANRWRRPKLEIEPPPRCNAPMVYDPATGQVILFGGYDQSAALNDTWCFDCQTNRWREATPKVAPPPMYAPATAVVPGGGKVLVCGNDARAVRIDHQSSTSADKQAWVYDTVANRWRPVDGDLRLQGYSWLTAASAPEHDVVLLVAFGPERRTYAFRYDETVSAADLAGATPGTVAWKYPEQKLSLEQTAEPDLENQKRIIASLPANRFIDAQPPGLLISKTWSTATIDTDRSAVIYTGGGHSGYSGNDFAQYNIAENRWRLDFPPRFPPFLESTNAGIAVWSYGMMPFSQHTYLWYCYDPQSKTVVYLARPSLPEGAEVQVTDDPGETFVYSADEHGYASWVYDPRQKKMHRPSLGRTFANPWHLALVGTPEGVYAACNNQLFHGTVDADSGDVAWRMVDAQFPRPRHEIKYHYEFQPLLFDSRRDRLVQLKGDKSRVDVYVRPLGDTADWQQLDTVGSAAIGREAVYIAEHDAVLWLADRQLFAFDCAANRLAEVDIDLPDGLYTHECALVYDPKYDVCIALIPARFSGPMQTFLYRFDSTTAKYHP